MMGLNFLSGRMCNKHLFLLVFPVLAFSFVFGQTSLQENLDALSAQRKNGTLDNRAYLDARISLTDRFKETRADSVIIMLRESIVLCRQDGYKKGEVDALRSLGNTYETKRLFNDALNIYDEALDLAKKTRYKEAESRILNNQGSVYLYRGSYPEALEKFYAALKMAEAAGDKKSEGIVLNNLANLFYFQNKLDDAEIYYQKTLSITREISDSVGIAYAHNNLGELYLIKKDYGKALVNLELAGKMARDLHNQEIQLASGIALGELYDEIDSTGKAIVYFEDALKRAEAIKDPLYQSKGLLGLARLRYKSGNAAEALQLAEKVIAISENMGQNQLSRDGHALLAAIHEASGNGMAALQHYKSYKLYADSLNNLESERAAATQAAEYAYSKRVLQFQRKTLQQRWLLFSAFAGLFSLGIIVFIINRNRRRLNHANHTLQDKNQEIQVQKNQLEETLNQLKATQAQLIHSEKMASLGELTAGIAHEIQNPLNFVNNFSEVSIELLEELQQQKDQVESDIILSDVSQNLEKILLHGKRADAIVKSMLYHSRSGSGKMESTDLNALCEEYLKLSFHGVRARDKSFNGNYRTSFDPLAGSLQVIPQELGRVLLNLFNNAFYATAERQQRADNNYRPDVLVSTKRIGDEVEIIVEDNGTGIPEAIREKIFQPFLPPSLQDRVQALA